MKVVKDFLENSSIHGFFFVGDSKHPLIRFFWIATVIAGFVGSYIMISISVGSWTDNQVSTTVQTLPISGVTIPRVTVCPPKGTFTNLNYDLVMADSLSLDGATKDLLTQEAVRLIENAAYQGTFNNFTAFREKNRYRNLFLGLTNFKLVYTNIDSKSQAITTYEVSTSAGEGEFSSPGLGQPFQEDQFDNYATFIYSIHHHRNVSTHINIKLHLGKYKTNLFQTYSCFFGTLHRRFEGVWGIPEQL